MSTFERYLTVWVALCIIAGIAFGHSFPAVFHVIGSAEIAKVNLPVARGSPSPYQCDRKTGTGGRASILMVAPPRINSRIRECPYAPMTRRFAFRYVT
jgi:hypothetical protein